MDGGLEGAYRGIGRYRRELRERGVSVDDVLIAAVWVNPKADDAEAVFANNEQAMLDALAMGQNGLTAPTDAEVWNPFFTPRDRPAAEPR